MRAALHVHDLVAAVDTGWVAAAQRCFMKWASDRLELVACRVRLGETKKKKRRRIEEWE
jgi:hypothetical protein